MSGLLLVWAACATALASVALLRVRAQCVAVARAAHELRGGLCVARLALDAGRGDAVRVQLDRARRALADLESAAPDRDERFELGALLRAATDAWPSVRLAVPPRPLLVRGDRIALAQACTNLVVNALEHGAEPVTVKATGGPTGARIEVTDAGPGLPAPVAALRSRGGRGRRGHGLAIAADVAERHGGRLGSAPSESGATLVLELPAA